MVGADDVGVQMRKQAERDQDIVYAPDAEAAKSVYLGAGGTRYMLQNEASTGTMDEELYVAMQHRVKGWNCYASCAI